MKYSTRLSDAVHVLVLIALNPLGDLSSGAIANSVHTNPGFIRQIMMALRRAGIISSVAGRARPSLTKAPREVTLLHVYKAVEGEKPLLHLDTHINPECGVGVNIQHALRDYYTRVQNAAEKEMDGITLQDIITAYQNRL